MQDVYRGQIHAIHALTILVSYSEIALKSRYVRNNLERSLAQDIVNILKKNGYEEAEAH